MISLNLSIAAVWMLYIWTIGCAADCGEHQLKSGKKCCDMCRPGEYMQTYCTENQQTVCSPCQEGSFSNKFNVFDRCKKCQTCPQEYAENCTRSTNAKCSCRPGFLCSNNLCSACEENRCTSWETVTRTEIPSEDMTVFSYRCEPKCSNNSYFDLTTGSCHRFTQCRTIGLVELFRGNKTHDSVCNTTRSEPTHHGKNSGDWPNVVLGIGFVLVSLILLVVLCYACIKSLRKHREKTNLMRVNINASDFHLSKEESAPQFMLQYESKDSSILDQMLVAKVTV